MNAAWAELGGGVDAEAPPLLGDHRPGAGHDRPRFALDHHLDREALTVRHVPVVALAGEAGALEELGCRLGVLLPPSEPEGCADLLGIGRDLVSHRRPEHIGDLLADGRVIGLDHLLARVDLEAGEPLLHRLVIEVRMRAGRRNGDRRDRRGAAIARHRQSP